MVGLLLNLPSDGLHSLRVFVLLFSLILVSVLHVTGALLKNAGLNGLRCAVLSPSCGLTLSAPALQELYSNRLVHPACRHLLLSQTVEVSVFALMLWLPS